MLSGCLKDRKTDKESEKTMNFLLLLFCIEQRAMLLKCSFC